MWIFFLGVLLLICFFIEKPVDYDTFKSNGPCVLILNDY